jgi:hypothetical protein
MAAISVSTRDGVEIGSTEVTGAVGTSGTMVATV